MGAAPAAAVQGPDTRVVTEIQRAFAADGELSQYVIDVNSKDGLVVLSGVASSEVARERAAEIARGTPHVLDIENQLTVRQG